MPIVVTADDAIRRIPNGATVLVNPSPMEEVLPAFRRVFEASGGPRDLTVVFAAGLGPFGPEARGMNHVAVPGMLKRVVAGHIGLNHRLVRMVAEDAVECYILPQGVLAQLYREIAAKRPGVITTVGLDTFVDPRIDGGKMNARTRAAEDLVNLIHLDGEEYLHYKSFPVHAGILRATTADPHGNLTHEDEPWLMECMEVAMAAKNSGGIVIAQVERLSETPADPRHVRVPGSFIDYVVVAQSREAHPHTLFVEHDPALTGQQDVPLEQLIHTLPLGIEKVICRRAAAELGPGMSVNLGIGIPQGVAAVAFEEGLFEQITMNTELGVIGGVPTGGKNFGPARNPSAFISQPQMFDFYDGGGLDVTCLGLAQADREGNVNVSKLGARIIGCGGFINLSQGAKQIVFCGEFRAGGFDGGIENGKLVIRREGSTAKFLGAVEQITFSGKRARRLGHNAMFITERCVFRLVPEGLLLAEVAPGIDIQRDILDQMEFRPIVPDAVPLMQAGIFDGATMGMVAAK